MLPTSALDSERGKRVLTFLASERLLPRRRLHRPEPASLRFLSRIHPDTYLESLQETAALLPVLGFEVDEAGHDAFLDSHRSMVGGTALATRLARSKRGVAVNLGGGFHHARAARGQGFCVFNDVATAIAAERARGMKEPVLVVDLDLHDGEGTRAIFAADETVHTFSIHNRHLGPTEALASTSIDLGERVDDATYLETVRSRLPEVVERTDPGLVFYLAGVDPAADDLMGNWEITAEALLQRDLFVLHETRAGREVGLVVLLAGGYGKRAWRYSARFLGRLLSPGRAIEPPATEELSLAEYRHIARRLEPADLVREESASDWSITEEDVMGALQHTSRSSRFLDYYSRHGVEVAFERYGIMDRLRELGFGRLRVEIDLEDAVGQTLAVVSDDFPSEPLIELRVGRDATAIPGMELLRVEWLQLRNPKRSFTEARPRLPGQKSPGLGLLRNIVGMLVMTCERLGLEGIFFTPSHYHLAVQSRKLLRFLKPEDEARFRAIVGALEELPLADATAALAAGRVRDDATGLVVSYTPAPMVLPVGDRLKARVGSPAYEDAVAENAGRFGFRLFDEP